MATIDQSGRGFALVCSGEGVITEILWDDRTLGDNLVGLSHFVCIFDPASAPKGLALFLHVKEHGVAFGWEIDLAHDNQRVVFRFSAAQFDGRIVLLAHPVGDDDCIPSDDIMRTLGGQLDALPDTGGGNGTDRPASTGQDTLGGDSAGGRAVDGNALDGNAPGGPLNAQIIQDMLQLNNRLVNAERELARKNTELRRLSTVLSKDLYLAHRVLQCSGEAVAVSDRDRRIVDVNQAFTGITGFGRQEAIGTELALCEHSGNDDGFLDTMWDTVKARGFWQGECKARRRSGEVFPTWLSVSAVPDESDQPGHYVAVFSDITRLKSAEEKWQRLAFYDSLTDLPNRVLFKDRLQQAINKARRDQHPLSILFIDLDDFKTVNDSHGHDAGDRLLCEAARRIEACVREADSICRLGGDEFTVIVSGDHNEVEIVGICDKIILAFNAPFFIGDGVFHVGASIGIARYPSDGEDPDALTKNADTAMYAAKSGGRNTCRFFSRSLGDRISENLALKTQMIQGLRNGEFLLHLQPEIDLHSGNVQMVEALVRWRHPERGLIYPGAFIPLAEESGVIQQLGEFVIAEAARTIRELRDNGWPNLRISVNVSRRQLLTPGMTDTILAHLKEQRLPGSALMIEITESMVMSNLGNAIKTLCKLRDEGVTAAVDDFGTGYSSLSLLRRLPVEFIKIDKSFVADADLTSEGESIVRAICVMAKSLGLQIIAEGVERKVQHDMLTGLGCDMVQGYWYSRALPYDALVSFLRGRTSV
jgi:diguanylate cyclase (GGDEF)-like protein/PAS domain S-box-containing protein